LAGEPYRLKPCDIDALTIPQLQLLLEDEEEEEYLSLDEVNKLIAEQRAAKEKPKARRGKR